MLANVGNVSPHCAEQAFSLCLVPLEERVAAGLAALDPDVVALIEVLPPGLCDGVTPRNPANSCTLEADGAPPQVQRLLAHDAYDVVCGDRNAWDCLAVRASLGSLAGCGGGYCGGIARSVPLPDGCDGGFETFVHDAEVAGLRLTIGVGHPDSSDVGCRTAAVEQLFGAFAPAARGDRAGLVLGDLNLEPYRESDASVDAWDDATGTDGPLRPRSGLAEADPPRFTLRPFESAQLDPTGALPGNVELGDVGARTLDHVLTTDELDGTCLTLGEAPGTERLEGPAGGLDHRAIACELSLVAAPPTAPGAETGAGSPGRSGPAATAPPGGPDPGATSDARPLPATGAGTGAVGAALLLLALTWRPPRHPGGGLSRHGRVPWVRPRRATAPARAALHAPVRSRCPSAPASVPTPEASAS